MLWPHQFRKCRQIALARAWSPFRLHAWATLLYALVGALLYFSASHSHQSALWSLPSRTSASMTAPKQAPLRSGQHASASSSMLDAAATEFARTRAWITEPKQKAFGGSLMSLRILPSHSAARLASPPRTHAWMIVPKVMVSGCRPRLDIWENQCSAPLESPARVQALITELYVSTVGSMAAPSICCNHAAARSGSTARAQALITEL
mmetsp:Transcript_9280/g.26015  ORF Transcript_9280/g.26015 Transcript_9280/m.26015 type:complete len:207 (+) Transcript_9280:61-681(+)